MIERRVPGTAMVAGGACVLAFVAGAAVVAVAPLLSFADVGVGVDVESEPPALIHDENDETIAPSEQT